MRLIPTGRRGSGTTTERTDAQLWVRGDEAAFGELHAEAVWHCAHRLTA